MIIDTRKELTEVLRVEAKLYLSPSRKKHLIYCFEKPLSYRIWKWQRLLRICEYWQGQKGNIAHIILHIRKKQLYSLGSKLNIEIYPGCMGLGLKIYHTGIIINNLSKIGNNCKLHGHNCIGNNGIDNYCPMIGNDLNVGIGACVIGNIKLGDHVVIGAGSIVNKSFDHYSIIVGVPGKQINKR